MFIYFGLFARIASTQRPKLGYWAHLSDAIVFCGVCLA